MFLRSLILMFASLGLFSSNSFVAAETSALQTLQKNFRGKKGFTVRFVQEIDQSTFKDQRNNAEGEVQFLRPNDLIWTYEKPKRRVIQYRKSKLTITEEQETQEVKETGPLNLQESFSFLWGETNQTLYKIEAIDSRRFKVTPRNAKKASFRSIEVRVENGRVAEAKIENNLEGVSRLTFSDWKLF